MFLKHFAGKNQLPGFYLSGTLVEIGLSRYVLINIILLDTIEVLTGKTNNSISKNIEKKLTGGTAHSFPFF